MKDFQFLRFCISELLFPLFTGSCFHLLPGVHSEAGGSGAGFVSHLPHPEDPHGPQAVPRLHAPRGPPPTALVPSKCHWCWVFTLQWPSRYQNISSFGLLLMGLFCPQLERILRGTQFSKPAVLNLERASESLGGFDKMQIARPHPLPRSFRFRSSGRGPGNSHFDKFPGDVDATVPGTKLWESLLQVHQKQLKEVTRCC